LKNIEPSNLRDKSTFEVKSFGNQCLMLLYLENLKQHNMSIKKKYNAEKINIKIELLQLFEVMFNTGNNMEVEFLL
jgi:hypothetical protein